MELIFPALIVAVLLGGLLYVAEVRAWKRREALGAVARRLGLRFHPSDDPSLHRNFRHSIFQKGRDRKSTNNMLGFIEISGHPVEVRMGDYAYVTGSGKSRQTHLLSYACFLLPFLGTPDLLIREENLGDKLLGGLGFDDIDFESEEFSRRFWVKSGDKRYGYDVIHPRMMEFLLEGPTPQVEIVRDVCLVLEGSTPWDPDTFEGAVGWFREFLSRWPEHLTEAFPLRRERPL